MKALQPTYLEALNEDRKGNWEKAHLLIQDLKTPEAAWIHAYLHRKEGDQFNASYWYQRADKPVFDGSLEDEWNQIWNALNN